MNTASAENLFESFNSHTLELNTIAVLSISNALERFKKTNQNLENFHVTLEAELEDGVILISFTGKLAPGKKGLGQANSLGRSFTYRASRSDGKIISEHLQR